MKSKSDIRKGSTIWYWNYKSKTWSKGKVLAVNRSPICYLVIKKRNKKGITINTALASCVPASDPKPTYVPYDSYTEAYAHSEKIRELRHHKSSRLLKRMGFL